MGVDALPDDASLVLVDAREDLSADAWSALILSLMEVRDVCFCTRLYWGPCFVGWGLPGRLGCGYLKFLIGFATHGFIPRRLVVAMVSYAALRSTLGV